MSYATDNVPMDVRSVLMRARDTLQLGRQFAGQSREDFWDWAGHADMVEQQITSVLESVPEEKPTDREILMRFQKWTILLDQKGAHEFWNDIEWLQRACMNNTSQEKK